MWSQSILPELSNTNNTLGLTVVVVEVANGEVANDTAVACADNGDRIPSTSINAK
jgi:hypothetical protein